MTTATPIFNIEDTDPYLDAEAGAWLHLEDRREFPATKLYADRRADAVMLLNTALAEERAKPGTYKPEELEALRADTVPRLPVRMKFLGFMSDRAQQVSTEIEKESAALRQQRLAEAKAAGANDEEAKAKAVLTEAESARFDAKLYAALLIDSENLGYKGFAKLTRELAEELFAKRADIRAQIREFLGKLANFKRTLVAS